MRRTPSIVSVDSTQQLMSTDAPTDFQKWTYKPSIAWDRKVFRAAGAIISASAWAARDFANNYPESAEKVTVLPWPVRFQSFPESWLADRAARGEGCTVFLFMGNDFERKGGHTLLNAWRELKLQNAVLRIATGLNTPVLELPPGVELIRGVQPQTEEWRSLWRNADVFVLPTLSEAFGIVFQEAAAAGLPVIGTRINAIPEIVSEGRDWSVGPSRRFARAWGWAIARLASSQKPAPELRFEITVADARNWIDRCLRKQVDARDSKDFLRKGSVGIPTQIVQQAARALASILGRDSALIRGMRPAYESLLRCLCTRARGYRGKSTAWNSGLMRKSGLGLPIGMRPNQPPIYPSGSRPG